MAEEDKKEEGILASVQKTVVETTNAGLEIARYPNGVGFVHLPCPVNTNVRQILRPRLRRTR